MRRSMIFVVVLAFLLIVAGITVGQDDSAFLRIAQFSVDAPLVDIYVNGDLTGMRGLAFSEVTRWVNVSAGDYEIAVVPFGEPLANALVIESASLSDGDWLTVALVGFVDDNSLFAQPLIEDYGQIRSGEARVSFFHGVAGAPPVNAFLGETEIVHLLGYPGFFGADSDGFTTADVVARDYDIRFTPGDDPETDFVDVGSLQMGANRNYFIAALGIAADPQFVLVTTDMNIPDALDGLADLDLGEGTAHVRVAHFSPGTPEVDVYVDGELSNVQGADFPSVSIWTEMPAGVYSVAVVPAGAAIGDALIGPLEIPLGTDTWTTLATIGLLDNDTLSLQALQEDYSDTVEGEARISVFNGIPTSEPLTLTASDAELVFGLGYPGYFGPDSDGFAVVDILAGDYDILLAEPDEGEIALDVGEIMLGTNRNYFIAAVGLPDDPLFVVEASDIGG